MTLPIDHHIWQQIDSKCFCMLCTRSLCVIQPKNISQQTKCSTINRRKTQKSFGCDQVSTSYDELYRKMISMVRRNCVEWFTKVKAKVLFDLFLLFLEWISSSTLTIEWFHVYVRGFMLVLKCCRPTNSKLKLISTTTKSRNGIKLN